MAAAAARVAGSQATPLDIVDIGSNRYPLPAPSWWATPGGDLVAMALAQHPALVEANQRFCLSDSATTTTTTTMSIRPPPTTSTRRRPHPPHPPPSARG